MILLKAIAIFFGTQNHVGISKALGAASAILHVHYGQISAHRRVHVLVPHLDRYDARSASINWRPSMEMRAANHSWQINRWRSLC